MLRTLKDARRRVVETVLEAAGASEKTTDEDYDNNFKKFYDMVEDMNECGAALSEVLIRQKAFFTDAVELSKSLSKIYTKNCNPDYWSNAECNLVHLEAVQRYHDSMKFLNEVYRSSSAMVCKEQGLIPLEAAVVKFKPEVEASDAKRQELVKDFDSYRRRLREMELARDAAQIKVHDRSQEKNLSKNTLALEEVQIKVHRLASKVQTAKDLYTDHNHKAKVDIIRSKIAHDQLIEMLFLISITAQAELFSKTAAMLNDIILSLPQDKVNQIRGRISQFVLQGGVMHLPDEKSQLQKGLELVSGMATTADFKRDAELREQEIHAQEEKAKRAMKVVQEEIKAKATVSSALPLAAVQPPQTAPYIVVSQVVNIPHTPPGPPPPQVTVTPHILPPPPAPPVVPAPNTNNKHIVIGLYNHEAEDDDELTFFRGDHIEVLETNDSGWWRGRLVDPPPGAREEGLFPMNYVEHTKQT